MLLELQIHNFLIIESLNLSFESGMTVITGETGAGKSILLDALQFVAGGRSDAKLIREGKSACEVSVQFSQNGQELVLKRILNQDGRNKAYINGALVSVGELRSLGDSLLNWVGQYEHQALLRADAQMNALDHYAKDEALLQIVHESSHKISELLTKLQALQDQAKSLQEVSAFKAYQAETLQALNLNEQEWDELHQEQKRLASGEAVLSKLGEMLGLLREDEQNIISQIKRLEKEVGSLAQDFNELENANRLCTEASVNLEEAYHELKGFYDSLDLDPARLQEVEARLSEIHNVSRKLQIAPEGLFVHYQSLQDELQGLGSLDSDIKACMDSIDAEKTHYRDGARDLTKARMAAAEKLSHHVSNEIKTLGMKEGEFKVEIETDSERFSEKGQEQIAFYVRVNPGQRWSALKDGASGGELSRIALVIAILNAKQNEAGTLIFDEVDVGVSGAVAQKVGALLRTLGKTTQVLCITHLPQVAMMGEHHIHVSKAFINNETFGSAKTLNQEERIEEVARIMSGENITDHARQLAREGLAVPSPLEYDA